MAAHCLGAFGAQYNYAWSRNRAEHDNSLNNNNNKTVWVTKRYTPTDLRVLAPVPRHKLLSPDVKNLPRPSSEWIQPREAGPFSYSRDHQETRACSSGPSTRCEEWSTLRQMLPSRGRSSRHRPPNWGTGDLSAPPNMEFTRQKKFPHINSPMTRYVDDLHLTNRLFKLH